MTSDRLYFDINVTVSQINHGKYSMLYMKYRYPKFLYENNDSVMKLILKSIKNQIFSTGIEFVVERIYNDRDELHEIPSAVDINARISFDKKDFFMEFIRNKHTVFSLFNDLPFMVSDPNSMGRKRFRVTHFDYEEVENVVQ